MTTQRTTPPPSPTHGKAFNAKDYDLYLSEEPRRPLPLAPRRPSVPGRILRSRRMDRLAWVILFAVVAFLVAAVLPFVCEVWR